MEGNEVEKELRKFKKKFEKPGPKQEFDLEKVRLAAQVSGLENRLLSANSDIQRRNGAIKHLETELTRTSKELDDMTTKYNELSRKYDDLYRKTKP